MFGQVRFTLFICSLLQSGLVGTEQFNALLPKFKHIIQSSREYKKAERDEERKAELFPREAWVCAHDEMLSSSNAARKPGIDANYAPLGSSGFLWEHCQRGRRARARVRCACARAWRGTPDPW